MSHGINIIICLISMTWEYGSSVFNTPDRLHCHCLPNLKSLTLSIEWYILNSRELTLSGRCHCSHPTSSDLTYCLHTNARVECLSPSLLPPSTTLQSTLTFHSSWWTPFYSSMYPQIIQDDIQIYVYRLKKNLGRSLNMKVYRSILQIIFIVIHHILNSNDVSASRKEWSVCCTL